MTVESARADDQRAADDQTADDQRADDDRTGSPWHDLDAYVATPRLTALVLSPDGRRLLAGVSELDGDRTAYRTAWWSIDPAGVNPARRLTRSVHGDAAAAYVGNGDLLFTSKRDLPTEGVEQPVETEGAIWCLPADGGEAYVAARRDGGFGSIVTARGADVAVLTTPTHLGVADADSDSAKRLDRRTRKVNAILHDGYPVRHWDHDLGVESPRLNAVDLVAARVDTGDLVIGPDQLTALTGDVGRAIRDDCALSEDGTRLVVEWRVPQPRGVTTVSLVSIDTRTAVRTTVVNDSIDDFVHPVLSRDGTLVAAVHEQAPTPQSAPDSTLVLIDVAGARRPLAADWDVWPTPIAFSPDASTVYVSADKAGHSPLYAVDVATGARRRLTPAHGRGFGAFGSAVLSPDGGTLYAIRSSYADPGTVVAVATDGSGIRELRAVSYPPLPGTVHNVETMTEDGARVRGWLLLPAGAAADRPAPLALWIHGGPLGSWNAWSWRWCPWLMVSRGYAVLLPDPALSTGYGRAYVQRGWGRWGAEPYTDLMALTDAVMAQLVIDARAPVALGGSFGGYMANWIAGHNDRFAGIVTHASLWNLETFGPTTDASWSWAQEMSPRMRREFSPHRFADKISTPMLVIHGGKDYRVPISEGLALWWELCSRHEDDPGKMVHRFLYFPDENHWVLTPQHAIVWYETVLAFCAAVRSDGNFVRPESL